MLSFFFSSLRLISKLCFLLSIQTMILACSSTSTGSGLSKQSGLWCHRAVSAEHCRLELILTALTNEFRYQNGLQPLMHQPSLAYVAYQQSLQSAYAGKISHAGFPETRTALLLSYAPNQATRIKAENLARLKSAEKDLEKLACRIFQLWKESPAHRQQLLGPYRAHGASLVEYHGEIFAAAMFL